MKILIVNRFFGGAQIPTGRMAEDVARVLVEEGHKVTALASTGTYAGAEKRAQHGEWSTECGETDQRPGGGGRMVEVMGKEHGEIRVEEVRVPKWMPRALAWIWFSWQARNRIPQMDWDVCVLMTDPPLLPLLAARLKAKKTKRPKDGKPTTQRRVAVWLMDLYPEALAASHRIATTNPFYKWYFNKRQRTLAAADLLICLGDQQRTLLGEALAKEARTAVVPPWDDRGNIALATEESLQNLALYAGNLGEAHCFEEILAAAPYLPADWTIRFAARGAKLDALRAEVSYREFSHGLRGLNTDGVRAAAPTGLGGDAHTKVTLGARNASSQKEAKNPEAKFEITGYASEEETPGLLASARVHLITMSSGWEGIVVPSKLYGCIRTGRPVLFIGPENADTAREILAHDWGSILPPGASGEEVAAAILELAARETRFVRRQQGAAEVAELIQGLAAD